jgi:hypothetical protein
MSNSKISALTSATTPLAGTEVVPIVESGVTKKVSVNQILSPAAGNGLNFSANGGDTLTQYDEGTWTPSVTSSAGTITTVGTVSGNYTRVGRLVTVICSVTITTNGTGSGFIKIGSLPFSVLNNPSPAGVGKEVALTDKTLGISMVDATTMKVQFYDATYPGGNGAILRCVLTHFV